MDKEKNKKIASVQKTLTQQRTEFLSLVKDLNEKLALQQEMFESNRSHYETELTILKDAIGNPDVALSCERDLMRPGFPKFFLSNGGTSQAVNPRVSPIIVPMSEETIRGNKEMRNHAEGSGIVFTETTEDTEWEITFYPIRDLQGNNDRVPLEYRVTRGGSHLMDLDHIFSHAAGMTISNLRTHADIVLDFSKADHTKRWRRTYQLHYHLPRKQFWLEAKEHSVTGCA
jgi:hypothetical protein